ncbi:MAG: class I SAM-dependent methyltransferase [Actinomycetota bacterium]
MDLKLNARPCPLCGSEDDSAVLADQMLDTDRLDQFAFSSRKLPEYMHYRLVVCPVCELVYANPAPAPEALAVGYREAAYDSSEEARYAAATYGRLVASIMSRLPDKDSALDIGAGDGAFLERLLDLGFRDVAGVEPSRAPIEAAKPGIRALIRQGLFSEKDFSGERFSLITCFQTIEHLHDPLEVGRSICSLLKPGGAAIFVCHNRQALSARLLGRKSPIFDIEHLQLFSRASLESFSSKCGFQQVEVNLVVNRYPVRYWARLAPIPAGIKAKLLGKIRTGWPGSLVLALPAGNLAAIAYKAR